MTSKPELSDPMIYTVQKGANTVPNSSFLHALTAPFAGKNARLRNKISQLLESHAELEAVVNDVALKQPTDASSDQVQANLQERVRVIIEKRPDLEAYFRD
jgi:hypothetical protein